MKKPILFKMVQYFHTQLANKSQKSEAGFSLIELIVVVLIIGILSAIVAPSWQAFITRQRIRTVNGQVLQALQKAQSQAKLKKEDVTVEFYTTDSTPATDPPEIQIGDPPQPRQKLNANGEIKPGMVKLIVQECQTQDADGNCTAYEDDADGINFNYLGAVVIDDPEQKLPFAVTVSTPEGTGKRCVFVQTLLGGMRTDEGNLDLATGRGCP